MRILHDNSLTLVLFAMFLVSVAAMLLSGQRAYNEDSLLHGGVALGLADYTASGAFLSALFENWESEFLQMAVYVVLTAMLFQRGSAESRDPDDPGRANDRVETGHPVRDWLYARSLGLVLILLFIASFLSHFWFSMQAANAEALRHGAPVQSLTDYALSPQLWFESFQNWQSEFLSTAVLAVLSIFLRQQGSPESKPFGAPDAQTGE